MDEDPDEKIAGAGGEWSPLKVAIAGGALAAATAGAAYLGTRALAKRNGSDAKPLNSVMATAITACDLSHGTAHREPSAQDIDVSPGLDRDRS